MIENVFFSNLHRVDEGKMIEKIAVDVSNQVKNIMESNEVGVLFFYEEDENIEKFKSCVYEEMNGVPSIPIWYIYAFLLIYLSLLSLKSCLIL